MRRGALIKLSAAVLLVTCMTLQSYGALKKWVYVIDVIGGTTLLVASTPEATEGEPVELLGVDVPESVPTPDQSGDNWRIAVRGYVKSHLVGQKVLIQTDKRVEKAQSEGDSKTYVYVYFNRKLYNEIMIERGYGRVDRTFSFGKRKALERAEREARENLRGLWGVGKPKPVPNIRNYLENLLRNKTFYLKIDALRFTKSGYSPEHLMFWPYNIDVANVMEDGVYYRREGLADRTADGFIAQAQGHDEMRFYNPQPIRRGEEITIKKVGFKRDCFFTEFFTAGRQTSVIYFIYNKELRLVSEEEIFGHIYQVFAESIEELEAQETRIVEIGMTEEEVKNFAGIPEAILRPGAGVTVYIYEHFKVIFRDGLVEKLEY